MTDPTVSPPPSPGSAESVADNMRRIVRLGGDLQFFTIGWVEAVVQDLHAPAEQKVERIREALVAAELVRKESDASGLDYSRPADDPQPVAGRVEPHVGAVTDSGLVDESDPDSDAAFHARFLTFGVEVCNEQLKSWLDRHGITVVNPGVASLRKAFAADHDLAFDMDEAFEAYRAERHGKKS